MKLFLSNEYLSPSVLSLLAPLQEFPIVRYRAPKALDTEEITIRDLVPTKIAALIWNTVSTYKSTIPNFPQSETCELLILDRSVDQVKSDLVHTLSVYAL